MTPPLKTVHGVSRSHFSRGPLVLFYSTFTATEFEAIPLQMTRKSLKPVSMFFGTSKLVDAGVV